MRKRRILVVTQPLDVHGRAVAHAIRAKGHICHELFCSDVPTKTSITLGASGDEHGHHHVVRHMSNDAEVWENEAYDTVWLRRVEVPWLPESMHAGDREIAARHFERFLRDFFTALDHPGVFWVGHFERQQTQFLKTYQLRAAARAGLTIPPTILSNDPVDMRHFIEKCGGMAAHKLVQMGSWRLDGGETLGCYTSPVTLADLPTDATLRLCPAILQPLVEKAFEVRVASFGDFLSSVRIESQSDERAATDWRRGQWYVQMEPYELPAKLADQLRSFLRDTGLVMAGIDFIVTPDGEHVFLEANPQGQFLWMEDRAGLPLLDVASDFLIGASRAFAYTRSEPAVRLSEFLDLWESSLEEATRQSHVCPPNSRAVVDRASE